jgi:hypothetical protein
MWAAFIIGRKLKIPKTLSRNIDGDGCLIAFSVLTFW